MNTWHKYSGHGVWRSRNELAVLLGIGLVGLTVLGASAEWKEGSKITDLGGFGLKGTIPAWTGKVVVIDFWASWCGPCKASFPLLDGIYRRYKTSNVVVLAVNVDEKAADMKAFLEKHPVSFPVVHDAGKRLVEAASVQGMPTSFVVDQSGVIRGVHNGFYVGKTDAELVAEIESLLAARKGPK